jgi:hypothetical protein
MEKLHRRGLSKNARVALSAAMQIWAIIRLLGIAWVARPRDATRVCAPGERSDWILIVGDGITRGWGVHSHNEALPGHLARAVSASTGRGTDVVVVTAEALAGIRTQVLARVDAHYDAIVVVTGLEEALTLRDPEVWREHMRGFLASLTGPTGVGSPVVMVGIPPVRGIPAFDTPTGQHAAVHAELLNDVTRQVCTEFPGTAYTPLAHPDTRDFTPRGGSATYRLWATGIAASVSPLLGPSALR